jgi:hypothetical protein
MSKFDGGVRFLNDFYFRSGEEGNEWNVTFFRHFPLDLRTARLIAERFFEDAQELRDAFRRLFLRHRKFMVLKGESSAEEWLSLKSDFEYFSFDADIVGRSPADRIKYWLCLARRPLYRLRKRLKRAFARREPTIGDQ